MPGTVSSSAATTTSRRTLKATSLSRPTEAEPGPGRPAPPPKGFRSAVQYWPAGKLWLTVGTSGSDISTDNGETWTPIGAAAYNALSLPYAAGAKGAIARLQ